MSKLKRLVALMLTLVMLLSTLPATALATDAEADVPAEETVAVEEETADDEVASVEEETAVDEVAAVQEETVVDEVAAVEEETAAEEVATIEDETVTAEVAAVEEDSAEDNFFVRVNPLYEDVIDEDDIDLDSEKETVQEALCDSATTTAASYQPYSSAVATMRSYLANRTTSFTIYYYSTSYPSQSFIFSMVDDAMAHTGTSYQGDAIMWDWGYMSGSYGYETSGGYYYTTLSLSYTYYTTTSQESWVRTQISSIVSSLGLTGMTTYEKIKAIYDYICDNVVYDYAHLSNSSYTLQFTAYAALHNGTAVCQGYAVLFYRMALQAGIDARVVVGYAWGDADAPHAWNIVQIGSYYYNLDSTWDAGMSTYSYFLKCPANFDSEHVRDSDYTTSSFTSKYPMASSDYVYRLPLTPTLKSISNTTSGVTITWNAVSGATSYQVWRKVSGSSSWSKVGTVTTTSYTSTGVESGTTYTFTVKAVNSYGTSGYNATGLTIRYLATPKITLSNTSSGVKVAWGAISGAASYYVYRRTESGSYSKIATVASGTLNYTDTSASAGVRYYYAVRAYSGGYLSAYTSQYITRLTTPSGISVSNVKSGVQVKWNAVTGATSYQVWRKLSGSSSWSK
ncbi:MAG: fibronectin type III domain-containing protein, partial [Clostridiales bacterium]|nr:fibronectin type III domain-containing protein [Clostridiales bacterium]